MGTNILNKKETHASFLMTFGKLNSQKDFFL